MLSDPHGVIWDFYSWIVFRKHAGDHGPADFLRHYFTSNRMTICFSPWPAGGGRLVSVMAKTPRTVCGERSFGGGGSEAPHGKNRGMFRGFRVPGTIKDEVAVIDSMPRSTTRPTASDQAATLFLRRLRVLACDCREWPRLAFWSLVVPLLAGLLGARLGGALPWMAGVLVLVGAANGSREIAARRRIIESERRAGVYVGAVLTSTALYMGSLVIVQALWAACILGFVGALSGRWLEAVPMLAGIVAAMTAISVAISSARITSDRAALVSVYVVIAELIAFHHSGLAMFTLPGAGVFGLGTPKAGAGDVVPPWVVIVAHALLGIIAAWMWLRAPSRARRSMTSEAT